MTLAPYIDRARVELRSVSLFQVQRETALVWCGRACAAEELGLLLDAREYAHEATEHAALSGDQGLLLLVMDTLAAHNL